MTNDPGFDPGQQIDPGQIGPPAPPGFDPGQQIDPGQIGPPAPPAFEPGQQIDPGQIGPAAPPGFDPGQTGPPAPPEFDPTNVGGMTGNADGGSYSTMGNDGTQFGGMSGDPGSGPAPPPGFDTGGGRHEPDCRPLPGFDPMKVQADMDRQPQMQQGHPFSGPTYDQVVQEH